MYVLKAAREAAKTTGNPENVVAERTANHDTLGKLTYNNLVIGTAFASTRSATPSCQHTS